VLGVNARRALEHLHDGLAAVHFQHLTTAHCAVAQTKVHNLGETREFDVVENDQGSVDSTDRAVLWK
jgi:hypothetical protein